jgi:8-oxo-dGTP pyrophosphatase MutT (NUDIX family)
LLEAELQDDYVSMCSLKERTIKWMLKYIEVTLLAVDSILFSGERGTSIGNRILMLIVWCAELLRVFGIVEGTDRIEKMFHCPPEAHNDTNEEKPHGESEKHMKPDVFPEDLRYDNNMGDGDDCLLAVPWDMYASAREFTLAWEQYYKIVVLCGAWDEKVDVECLSMMAIRGQKNGRHQYWFIPNIKRNAQRLIANKIQINPGHHFAEGKYTFEPTAKHYAEIATDHWQRSFALKHTMVSRHLNRAMFEYCLAKAGNARTIYKADLHRLGKEDGDFRLEECLEDVRRNSTLDISGWAMVKAMNFDCIAKLSATEIKALTKECHSSDQAWSTLELTDDLCAHPDVLLYHHPIGPNVAAGLGFKQDLIEQLKRQLVKGEGVTPDMGAGTRTGGQEESLSDGASPVIVRAASVIVTKGTEVLCGREPFGKKRVGFMTFPGGKLEKEESFETAACRELDEEAQVTVLPHELIFVRNYTCGNLECRQFTVDHTRTAPSQVLTPDRLTDLKFRSAAAIIDETAPAQLANCIKEVLRDGRFVPSVFSGGVQELQASSTLPQNSPGHVTMHKTPETPVSSANEHPASEVKAATAEVDVAGPPNRTEGQHSHTCPMCATEYVHSHRYNPKFEHKQRPGACTNKACEWHKSAVKPQTKGLGALTSREQQSFRQPAVSSPVNGYGSPHQGKTAGKGKAGNCGTRVEPPRASNQNAGKSHGAAVESKGPSVATTAKGAAYKNGQHTGPACIASRWKSTAVSQTTAVPMTPAPNTTFVPEIVDGVSRIAAQAVYSEGQLATNAACRGAMTVCASSPARTPGEEIAEQARTSGGRHPEVLDTPSQSPGPGAAPL